MLPDQVAVEVAAQDRGVIMLLTRLDLGAIAPGAVEVVRAAGRLEIQAAKKVEHPARQGAIGLAVRAERVVEASRARTLTTEE
jgi:hypothetical protein